MHNSRLAENQKQLGLDLVEENNANFVETMRSEARMIARRQGYVTTDDLRPRAKALNMTPKSPNAWGAIFRGKEWKPKGMKKSAWVTNHGRKITIWILAL